MRQFSIPPCIRQGRQGTACLGRGLVMSGALRISRAMALALPLALTGALAAPSAARAVAPSDARQGSTFPPRICARRWKPRHRDGHFGAVWIGPGRWTPVVGVAWRYAPDAALRLLLEGTGLIAQAVGDKAFVLRPAPSAIRRRGVGAGAASPGLRAQRCSSACWTPCAGSRPARRASTARRWRCGSTGKGRSVRCACWIPRAARRATRRYARPCRLAGGRAVRRSGQGLRGAGVAAREPQAGGLRQRAPSLPATERE